MLALNIFEFVGTIAFAVSGAALGIKKKMDAFGVFILAVTTALGGGVVRDILIGNTPPSALSNQKLIIVSLVTTIAVCCAYSLFSRLNNIVQLCDAVGLGAFTAIGGNMAVENGMGTLLIILVVGMATGVGGGMLRDILAREIPFVFRGEVYAVASFLGAFTLFAAMHFYSITIAMYLSFMVTVTLRVLCLRYDIQLPPVRER